MNSYESIMLIDPSRPDEETATLIDKMKVALEKGGASTLKVDNWGKKKLAYEVKHERRGTYVCFQFQANGNLIKELERLYRMEDAIMKFMTVRLNEDQINARKAAVGTVNTDDGI